MELIIGANMGIRSVVKLIDYNFQNEEQLTQAYDDSNSMRGLSSDFDKYVIGRHGNNLSIHEVIDSNLDSYRVIFLPVKWSAEEVANYIQKEIEPRILHLHGNHGWPSFPYYAKFFLKYGSRLIFSPAGSSCGTPEFLSHFHKIIVNHPLQIERMKCSPEYRDRIVVRMRAADPSVFYPLYSNSISPKFDCVYIAGFVPVKQIPVMIDTVVGSGRTLMVIGDFTRTSEHYRSVKAKIGFDRLRGTVFLHDFISQLDLSAFLGLCGVFVWPNIKPENPSTTTNRSVPEALACGMPLLLGERAFKDTEFVKNGYNGYLYSSPSDFKEKAELIFGNLDYFRENSLSLTRERFDFQTNFIRFYDDLYSSML